MFWHKRHKVKVLEDEVPDPDIKKALVRMCGLEDPVPPVPVNESAESVKNVEALLSRFMDIWDQFSAESGTIGNLLDRDK
jgi:hypothetical protein